MYTSPSANERSIGREGRRKEKGCIFFVFCRTPDRIGRWTGSVYPFFFQGLGYIKRLFYWPNMGGRTKFSLMFSMMDAWVGRGRVRYVRTLGGIYDLWCWI